MLHYLPINSDDSSSRRSSMLKLDSMNSVTQRNLPNANHVPCHLMQPLKVLYCRQLSLCCRKKGSTDTSSGKSSGTKKDKKIYTLSVWIPVSVTTVLTKIMASCVWIFSLCFHENTLSSTGAWDSITCKFFRFETVHTAWTRRSLENWKWRSQ